MERGNRRSQYYIVCAVTSVAVTYGVSFSWATPVLPKVANDEIGFPLSKEAISWVVSISSLGVMPGVFISNLTCDKWGRRFTILVSSIPNFLGAILMIFAWEVWMLSFGRLLWGIGTGLFAATATAYVAEISDKDIRGQLLLINRFMFSFGCLLIITVGSFVTYQTLNYTLLVLPICYFMICWWILESPYYLLKEGKKEAARKTLKILSGNQNEDVIEEKLSQMQSQVKTEMRRSTSMKEFFTGKLYRKAIIISLGIKITQIMTGLHAIQNYMGTILLESKTEININTALITFGVIRFLLGIVSSVLIDRLGRRPLLIGSFIATGLLLAGIAIYYGIQEHYGTSYPYTLIPFIGILLAITMSVLGYESVAYLIPGELFPMNVKGFAIAMYSSLGALMNFLSVKSYQQIRDSVGLVGLFSTYTIAAILGAVFCYIIVPETKGKSLKEIQIELNGNIYDEEEKLNSVAVNNTDNLVENGSIDEGTKADPASK